VEAERIRRRVIAQGRVQGVAFRATTEREARAHGLAGFVRNLPDGSVEAVFEGAARDVEALVSFCRGGPRFARVTELRVLEEPCEGLAEFRVR
jgi:acylphosphatase